MTNLTLIYALNFVFIYRTVKKGCVHGVKPANSSLICWRRKRRAALMVQPSSTDALLKSQLCGWTCVTNIHKRHQLVTPAKTTCLKYTHFRGNFV